MIQIIRKRGMLRDFPGRTETDLYVWIDKHRAELAEQLGWSLDTDQTVMDLAAQPDNVVQRLGKRLRDAVLRTRNRPVLICR